MKILFWNVGKGTGWQLLSLLSLKIKADIILLAECSDSQATEIVLKLNEEPAGIFFLQIPSGSPSIKLISCYPRLFFTNVIGNNRFCIFETQVPGGNSLIIAGVHLPSKLHISVETQQFLAEKLRESIEEAEKIVGHKRTLVIGDFNFSPFESAMVSVNGLNAVMDSAHLMRASRSFRERRWGAFYNPMWSLQGDRNTRAPGSYYYHDSGNTVSYYWHMFDQVILREALVGRLAGDAIELHTSIEGTNLIKRAAIDPAVADHLPVSVRLDMEGIISD